MILRDLVWGSFGAKMVTSFAGAVAAVAGAITGLNAAAPLIDPWLLAHRGYVIEKIGGVQTTTNELLIWKFEDSKTRARVERGNLDILLKKEQNPEVKSLIEQNIERNEREQRDLDERIKKLRGR